MRCKEEGSSVRVEVFELGAQEVKELSDVADVCRIVKDEYECDVSG